jgi:hypothetical protein
MISLIIFSAAIVRLKTHLQYKAKHICVHSAFICVMHMDVRMPRALRPPWMAEGRATQEQLPRSAEAAHLR